MIRSPRTGQVDLIFRIVLLALAALWLICPPSATERGAVDRPSAASKVQR